MDFSLNQQRDDDQSGSEEELPDESLCLGFRDLPHDIILQILFFNLNYREMTRIKRLNKQCYSMLNPNDPVVNMLWECITRHSFPFMASILKCRRWDLYFKFRTLRIRQIQRAGSINCGSEKADSSHSQIQQLYHQNAIHKKSKRRPLSLQPGDGSNGSNNSDDIHTMDSVEDKLHEFERIAMSGQLFLKHTKRRSQKPQYRIVKVHFDQEFKAKEITWGSGSRRIPFSEIRYISWGHYTPIFDAKRDELKKELCLSVVGTVQILDLEASEPEMAELWVRGLRQLKGHSDDASDRMASDALKHWNFPRSAGRKRREEQRATSLRVDKQQKALYLLQQDLFTMTTTAVFQELEEEGIWNIDQRVRDKFNARSLYQKALRDDVAWKEWKQWIREQVVSYLGRSNRISSPRSRRRQHSRHHSHHHSQHYSQHHMHHDHQHHHSRQLSYVSTTSTMSTQSGMSGPPSSPLTPNTPNNMTPEPSSSPHVVRQQIHDPRFKSVFVAECSESMVEGVIQNCNFDIEDINQEYDCHIAPTVKQTGKVYKAKMGTNGLPSGFKKRSMMCPLILRGKNSEEFVRKTEPGVYSCHRCYGTIFAVNDANDFKKRVVNQQCVRIVYETGDHHENGCHLM